MVSWNSTLEKILDFLKFLNKLNNGEIVPHDNNIMKVPHDVFYLHELIDCINIRNDYWRWRSEGSSVNK